MKRGRELTSRKWNGSLMSGAITGHLAKPKCGRISAMLKLCSFSLTTVPASSSQMLCPSIGLSQASTMPISWSAICAVRCGRRDHTFLVKTHHSAWQCSAACRWRSEPVTGRDGDGSCCTVPHIHQTSAPAILIWYPKWRNRYAAGASRLYQTLLTL